jgi:transitional endoplasmic reticulum ATPase
MPQIGHIVRVALVDDEIGPIVAFQSGQRAVGVGFDEEVAEGDVFLVDDDLDVLEQLPAAAWPEPTRVGVVLRRVGEVTLIELGSVVIDVPSTGVDYAEGHTVRFTETRGVLDVLHREPVRAGLSDDIAQVVRNLRYKPDPNGLNFRDFGGMPQIVSRARKLIYAPLLHAEELKAIGARPVKGVLFTGDPGTGKTHLAQIIGNQAGATFYLVNGPSIVSKYVGQTEAVIRAVFTDAAENKPAIVFFDEIDSIAGRRTAESREYSRQLVTQLLTSMDGFERESGILVIGATNRAEDLDPALRRPGRLDWEVEFGTPTASDRLEILRVSARDISVEPGLDHAEVVARTDGWTPAELTAIWTEASLLSAMDGRSTIAADDYLGGLQARERQRASRVRENAS